MTLIINDPREMCSAHGIPRPDLEAVISPEPQPSITGTRGHPDHQQITASNPRSLTFWPLHVPEPKSALSKPRVVVFRPGWPAFDWATEPEFCTPG